MGIANNANKGKVSKPVNATEFHPIENVQQNKRDKMRFSLLWKMRN